VTWVEKIGFGATIVFIRRHEDWKAAAKEWSIDNSRTRVANGISKDYEYGVAATVEENT
jgi:hypothetical protein